MLLFVIVAFILCWLILWLFTREHITALGIKPNKRRLKEFFLGFVLMALFCTINTLGQSYFKGVSYIRNYEYGFIESLNASWWTFKAALYDELVFRGAILYLLIKRLGVNWGCLISAVAFGIYHWFSYEVFGSSTVLMVYVFLITGAPGWMFAYAFAKTKSLYAPLGLHFGWTIISSIVFSAGPLGDSLFTIKDEAIELGGWEQLLFFSWQTIIIPGAITWFLVKKYKPLPSKTLQK